ncbi:hypothetical protein E4U42_005426 [Claviceps africana]|uniref:UBC core domain-containing protein n=1 Tax=Claviceps africana TaxID=83212 RepID=A0A8K0NFK7_9HYPO|nr:hypothetical protein E4U42_005426 [Claviceps africana]
MSASAKAFYADLVCVKKFQFDHVSAIRRGDSDGEITFKYSNTDVEEPLEIQVVATDLNSYPHGTSYMVFTSSETCSSSVVKRLEQLSVTTRCCSLHGVIEAICHSLASRLDETRHDMNLDSVGDGDAGNYEGDDTDGDLEAFEPIDVVDDEYFEVQGVLRPMWEAEPIVSQNIDGLQRIQKELKACKLAGFSVGIYSILDEFPAGIVSLSIRVSKLNLPSAAISAWGLETTDYLVLLVKFLRPYPDLAAMLSDTRRGVPVVFRFGKCKTAKPSVQCASMAFRPMQNMEDEPETEPDAGRRNDGVQPSGEQDKVSFNSIYMSNTINDLLNRRFFKLLKMRLDQHCSWDMAQELLDELEGQNGRSGQIPENANSGREHERNTRSSSNGPARSCYDDSMEDEWTEDWGFVLAAMRFSLRRLCKCTEYCMVCHQRMGNDIQSLKPYVCSKSLCLYQYLSLAFGTSLEAEIINNPYVVDLLTSLFYSSLASGCLREFPCGLALKVPHIEESQHNIMIEFLGTSNMLRTLSSEAKLGEDDWVLVVTRTRNGFEKSIWRILQRLGGDIYSFQNIYYKADPKEIAEGLRYRLCRGEHEYLENEWLPAIILPFSHDADDLAKTAQGMSLQQLLDATPSVLEMRKFLLEAPGRNLGTWTRMNRSALSLVRWIVASNTSYIVQDSAVPVVPAPVGRPSKAGLIKGLDGSWMQFRFAQGSPDKERAFAKAVQTLGRTNVPVYPTLFAWHGSQLGNWHGIIRTGLDFSRMLNGRAYGQGVYLSRHMNISKRYTGTPQSMPTDTYHDSMWPKSDLRPKCALSICEMINCTREFISTSPHYVINKTEWIQCRYLLLQVDPTANAMQNPMFNAPSFLNKGYIEQDPAFKIVGEQGFPLEIPRTTTSFAASWQRDGSTEAEEVYKDAEPITSATGQDGDSEDGDDPEDLTEKIQAMMLASPRGRKRCHTMTPSENVDEVPGQAILTSFVNLGQQLQTDMTTSTGPTALGAPMSALSPSTFRPGTLDLTTLPQLPDPAWAASSRVALQALTREIRELFKTQSQNEAASLGWYLDTARVSNLFQWIVELHTFDADLPLAKDMMRKGHASVVLELRFGSNFPMSPPFVRVIRPRFLPFQQGGGGHVTAGGAICSEMLTGSGWSPAMSMENVFVQIRLALCDTERPARLDMGPMGGQDYGIGEAVEAYVRAARTHGWVVPQDIKAIEMGWR